jgi:DNA-binding transcriptional regulator of glucitol operon
MESSPRPTASSSPADGEEGGAIPQLRPPLAEDARTQSKWLTKRAISLHLALAVAFPGFLALGWWQLHRALGGNELSWAYTFEWPFFACYAVYMWWRIIHDEDPSALGVVKRVPAWFGRRRHDQVDDDSDEALAAYNAHLAALRAYDAEKNRRTGDA